MDQHMRSTVAHFVSKLRLRGVARSMTHSWCYLLFGYVRLRVLTFKVLREVWRSQKLDGCSI